MPSPESGHPRLRDQPVILRANEITTPILGFKFQASSNQTLYRVTDETHVIIRDVKHRDLSPCFLFHRGQNRYEQNCQMYFQYFIAYYQIPLVFTHKPSSLKIPITKGLSCSSSFFDIFPYNCSSVALGLFEYPRGCECHSPRYPI